MFAARKNAGFLPWLALYALVVLQFAVFQHESAHTAGEIADSCEICVQLDASTPITGDAPSQQALPVHTATEDSAAPGHVVARLPHDRSARGPPSLLI